RDEHLLELKAIDLSRLPVGVRATCRNGEVRYRTENFEVGFTLGRPGFSHLGLGIEDAARAAENVLAARPPLFHQGPQLHPLGAAPAIAPSLRCAMEGTTEVKGGSVYYRFVAGGQQYRLVWTVTASGLTLKAE